MISNTRKQIIEWIENGSITSVESLDQVEDFQVSADKWKDFLLTLSLWLGGISLVAGLIFFFAYNWDNLSRFYKFAIIETFLLGSVAIYFLKFNSNLKYVVQFVLALSVGSLLALIGQTYQTGADPWQLFATWAAFITPLVIISRASSLWCFWIVLINLSLLLNIEARHGFRADEFFTSGGAWYFILYNGLILVFLEITHQFRSRLPDFLLIPNRFAIRFSAIALLYTLCAYGVIDLFEHSDSSLLGLVVYGVFASACWVVYRFKVNDLLILSLISFSTIFVLTALFIKMLDNQLFDGGFIIITLVIVGSSTFAAIKLKQIKKEFSQKEEYDE